MSGEMPGQGQRSVAAGPSFRELARMGEVHFMGVAGAGMVALAEAVVRGGGQVSGCDPHVDDVRGHLGRLGVELHDRHAPEHLEGVVALVATAAVPPTHPELQAAAARGVPVLKRAQALGEWVNQGTVVGVAGTHGKTTTTALTATVLSHAGLDPTAFVGGQVVGWSGNFLGGRDDLFVVEADEYDRSFLTLTPQVAVVTNLEADHLDQYGSLDGVRNAFRSFVDRIPEGGTLVVCADDPEASRLATAVGVGVEVVTYGLSAGSMIRGVEVTGGGGGSRFRLVPRGKAELEVELPLSGLHNVRNALAAAAVGEALGAEWGRICGGLAAFPGVARRFQGLGEVGGVAVVDDYAHHPTEVQATLGAARQAFPGRRVVAVFQPHLFSRTRDFSRAFGEALATADAVWVTAIYPAREEPIPGVTGEGVAEEARGAGAASVHFHERLETLPQALSKALRPGDICLTLGAGSITSVGPRLLELLQGERVGGRKP